MPFRDVVGHRRILALLSQAIVRQTLAPSLIFAGPEGVGKRLTAVSVAQAVNCTTAGARALGDACGTCAACRRIARGAHADVEIIEPGDTGTIKVEQVRASIERAAYRPFEGARRVTIIDDADALVAAAQNALLKTLEEPLPASVFILVTPRPDALLPTVRSRCSQLRFGRLAAADVAMVLERDHKYSSDDAVAAAAASEGSVERALELETGEFLEARSDAEDLLRVAGRDPRTRLEQAKQLLKGGATPALEREHLGARLQALAAMLRDAGLVASGADSRLLVNADRQAQLQSVVRTLGSSRIESGFAAVTAASDALERNVSPKVIADWLAVQL